MRKVISGTALVLAATVLTGCGGDNGPETADKSVNASVKPKPKPDSGSGEVKHEVTLEVLGTGTSQVYYNLDTNNSLGVRPVAMARSSR